MSKITKRGTKWEILNSWWTLLSFFLMGWIGLLYAGITTKKRAWIIWGVIYCAVLNTGLALFNTFNQNVLTAILMVYWIGSIIHSFIIRKEYLIRREAILDSPNEKIKDQQYKQKIKNEYRTANVNTNEVQNQTSKVAEAANRIRLAEKSKNVASVQEINHKQFNRAKTENMAINKQENDKLNENSVTDQTDQLLDINNCSESQLEELPGVSLVMAKKAIAYRENKAGFASVDDFYECITLRPHFIAQINDRIKCGEYKKMETNQENHNNENKNNKNGKSGRILDI